ncbi:cupin domain-containing protein [Ramlibacter sp.]|uniref:cupin domain-containing protein n=1 Tax=Ramlibacter sp. TaxID=1917967 RepID=UPI003D122129
MDIDHPLALLGGLTPRRFMKRHWQKKPLLVRRAIEGFASPLARADLLALASKEGVESRAIVRDGERWRVKHGPFSARALPAASRRDWTLLVQGVDLHHPAAHDVLSRFRFVPDARLDDVMISWASDGGGVGPHFDSYDVFLLQAQGRRRWRIGRQRDLSLRDGVPLKILANFEPEEEYVLEPGDMLYLPPRWAHDGVAEGECQTWSIGFRAPARGELVRELLQRVADEAAEETSPLYRDPAQEAVESPAAIPPRLQAFARDAVAAALKDAPLLDRALGEALTEPKSNVWFESSRVPARLRGVLVDAKTRMMHDSRHVFVNGESWRASGRDASLMRRLADRRRLDARELAAASDAARALIRAWCEAGWLHETGESHG